LASDIRDLLLALPPPDETDLNNKFDTVLEVHRARPKIVFELVNGVPDCPRNPFKRKDRFIVVEPTYIQGPNSLDEAVDEAVDGLAKNIRNRKCLKRDHILILAYDPRHKQVPGSEYKGVIKREGRCAVRIAGNRQ
jgi:hypothetical protein